MYNNKVNQWLPFSLQNASKTVGFKSYLSNINFNNYKETSTLITVNPPRHRSQCMFRHITRDCWIKTERRVYFLTVWTPLS